MSLGGRRVTRLRLVILYIYSVRIYIDGCLSYRDIDMIIYENGFRVGVWVCECVSNPTRKLEWLIKLEVGYKMHVLDYDSKRNEKLF